MFSTPEIFRESNNNAFNSPQSTRQLQKYNVELVQSALLQLCQHRSVLVAGIASSLGSSSAHLLFVTQRATMAVPLCGFLCVVWAQRAVITEGGTIPGSCWCALAGCHPLDWLCHGAVWKRSCCLFAFAVCDCLVPTNHSSENSAERRARAVLIPTLRSHPEPSQA